MNEPIFWWNANFGKEEKLELEGVVDSNYLNEGPRTKELEEGISKYMNAGYACLVPNGTLALALSLWALGVKRGDEVILPDLTFVATLNAVHMVGATPILADIDSETFNISVESVREKLSPKTKVVILVHINGRPCDIEGFRAMKADTGLRILEDSAQALGSKYENRDHLGTLFDMGAISLAPSKVISTGQGGIILTRDEELRNRVLRLKDHGRLARSEMNHPFPGYNFKFTDLQAAVGLAQLNKLEGRLKKATADLELYQSMLKEVKDVAVGEFNCSEGEVPLWIDACATRKNDYIAYMKARNIEIRPFWDLMHRQWVGGRDEDFPNACAVEEKGFWLPNGPSLSKEAICRVCDETKGFFNS